MVVTTVEEVHCLYGTFCKTGPIIHPMWEAVKEAEMSRTISKVDEEARQSKRKAEQESNGGLSCLILRSQRPKSRMQALPFPLTLKELVIPMEEAPNPGAAVLIQSWTLVLP
jgi:hypothetical protein